MQLSLHQLRFCQPQLFRYYNNKRKQKDVFADETCGMLSINIVIPYIVPSIITFTRAKDHRWRHPSDTRDAELLQVRKNNYKIVFIIYSQFSIRSNISITSSSEPLLMFPLTISLSCVKSSL
jgi:hypothetical protein